jgi:hypothetical protein
MDNKEFERKLAEMKKLKEESDRRLLRCEWVISILSCIVLFVSILIADFLPMEDGQRIVILLSGIIPFVLGVCYAIRIEQVAGYYECKHCKHRYVPTYRAVNLAPHIGRTRYMRCPECGKKSWQKKVISKG